MPRRLLIFSLFALLGCTGLQLPQSSPQLVIEGWIEAGGNPVVIVTTTVPATTEWRPLTSLQENIVRWATVSVSDGENEVFLTGMADNDYFPPYVYTTAMMTGEVGKSYKLKVSYGGRVAEAQTIIPPAAELEYIYPHAVSDSSVVLVAGLKDSKQTKDYYKFFTKVFGRDSVYCSSFLGLVDDAVLLTDEVNDIQVFGGYSPSSTDKEKAMYFRRGDRVSVRLCTLDEDVYGYWEDLDDVASLSQNPFFPVMKKIRSNIKGGLGYWAGYGSSYYYVKCDE